MNFIWFIIAYFAIGLISVWIALTIYYYGGGSSIDEDSDTIIASIVFWAWPLVIIGSIFYICYVSIYGILTLIPLTLSKFLQKRFKKHE